eukprot:m.1021 g.1021  ORF g.1021 m.1021 type:complete len:270 (+) comp5496_c0_seq1:101-910(+)
MNLFVLAVVLSLLIVLFFVSSKVKYLVKYGTYLSFIVLISLLCIIYCKLVKGPQASNCLVIKWLTIRLRVAEILGIKYVIEGQEILREAEKTSYPHILVSNHQSSLDVLGMFIIWPKDTVAMAKKSLKSVPMFGTLAAMCKTVFIDRVKKEKAMEVMEETVQNIKSSKTSVWVFPEGTRNREGAMLPFKKGAFHLAVQAQIPIIPIVFSPYDFYNKKSMIFNSGTVKMTILKPIATSGLTADDVSDLSVRVREHMLAVFSPTGKEGKVD